jgi:hypothetical protein
MTFMKQWIRAVMAASFAVYSAGCTHVQVNRTDLTPSDAASFNAAAQGKPYSVRVQGGYLSEGPNGLAMRLSPQREWILSSYGTPPNRLDAQNFYLGKVETIRVFEGPRKSPGRGFADGALIGFATGTSLSFFLAYTGGDGSDAIISHSYAAFLGTAIIGGGMALIGGWMGLGKTSTIETENVYSPKGF